MNRFLNTVLKGLITAIVIVISGGILSLNIKTSPSTSMMLVSTSVVNSLNTKKVETKKEDVKVEQVKLEEEVVELEEKEESIEENKEEKVEEIKEEKKEEVQEVVKEEVKEELKPLEVAPTPEPEKPTVPDAKGNYSPNTETTSGAANSTFTGYVTAYGPDCYGCGGSTAMGDNVRNGNIYYNHPTYGTIRIVAGDRSILNKVVRISGLNISSEPVIAIVRDTGGDIGFNKPKGIVLDLLHTSEKSAEVQRFGMQWATVEVLN